MCLRRRVLCRNPKRQPHPVRRLSQTSPTSEHENGALEDAPIAKIEFSAIQYFQAIYMQQPVPMKRQSCTPATPLSYPRNPSTSQPICCRSLRRHRRCRPQPQIPYRCSKFNLHQHLSQHHRRRRNCWRNSHCTNAVVHTASAAHIYPASHTRLLAKQVEILMLLQPGMTKADCAVEHCVSRTSMSCKLLANGIPTSEKLHHSS